MPQLQDSAPVNAAIAAQAPVKVGLQQNDKTGMDPEPEMDPNKGDPADVIGNIGVGSNSGGANVPAQADNSNFVNNTNTDGYIVTGDEKDFDERLRSLLKCYDRSFEPETLQRGDFWVLKNYVRGEHGDLKCHESLTYTTHADYTFLDNLIPLLER